MVMPRKLSPETQMAVREWAKLGRNMAEVARRLKVSHQTIRRTIIGPKRRAA